MNLEELEIESGIIVFRKINNNNTEFFATFQLIDKNRHDLLPLINYSN